MGVNIQGFFNRKSIKLSDSFKVTVWYDEGKAPEELFNCAGFTLPKLEYNEETATYGNITQTFLIPKYDNPMELTLELYEGYRWESDKKFHFIVRDRFMKDTDHGFTIGKSFSVNQQFSRSGYTTNEVTYKEPFAKNTTRQNHDFSKIEIEILDNRLSKTVMKYTFTNLFVTNVKQYNLSYDDESLAKWEVSFICETYQKEFSK